MAIPISRTHMDGPLVIGTKQPSSNSPTGGNLGDVVLFQSAVMSGGTTADSVTFNVPTGSILIDAWLDVYVVSGQNATAINVKNGSTVIATLDIANLEAADDNLRCRIATIDQANNTGYSSFVVEATFASASASTFRAVVGIMYKQVAPTYP